MSTAEAGPSGDRGGRSTPGGRAARGRRPGLAALVAAAVTFLLVVGGGVAYALANPPEWKAESQLVVFPSETNAAARASYYETLSTGQIVETIAELLDAQLDDAAPADTSLAVQVVANTSIIAINATADGAEEAESTADESLGDAVAHVADLRIPFAATIVSAAEGGAEESGISLPVMLGAVVLAGLVAAFGVANVVVALGRARERATATEG